VIEPHGASERRPLRVLPWWVAVIGVTAVAVSITVTTLWLLAIAGHDPSLRIEAIKTGLMSVPALVELLPCCLHYAVSG
jgi:hypothetical protein